MRRILAPIFTTTLLAGIALTAAGCSGTPGSTESEAPESSAAAAPAGTPAAAATPAEETATAAAGATAAAASTPADVSATIKDPVMGYTFVASSVVRNFPFNDHQTALADRGDTEQVLVKVKVTLSNKFYTSAGCGDLSILPDGASSSTIPASENNSVVEDDMKAAGYTPLEDVDHGKTGTGWCSFAVQDPTDVLDLRYKRLAASTSGGKTIPEKVFLEPMKAA